MRDVDWDDLRFFLAVSERGSISAAAKLLNVNHSTVLRRLASLEKRLGSRLFDRLPDGYEMTAQGEELRNQLRGVSEQIESAQRSLSGRDLSLSGAIRITTTDTLMRGLLMPYLAEFHDLNPATQMEIVINNTFLSLTGAKPTLRCVRRILFRKIWWGGVSGVFGPRSTPQGTI